MALYRTKYKKKSSSKSQVGGRGDGRCPIETFEKNICETQAGKMIINKSDRCMVR